MTPDLIQRVVGLVGKNGERVVLVDPQSGRAVVLLDLESYERLSTPGSQPTVSAGSNAPAATVKIAPPPAPAPVEATKSFAPVREAISAKALHHANIAKNASFESKLSPMGSKSSIGSILEAAAKNQAERNPFITKENTGLGDLTQAELLDKINRDIGQWKTAQEAKRTEELKSAALTAGTKWDIERPAARKVQTLEATPNLEEEERFFLEPIE